MFDLALIAMLAGQPSTCTLKPVIINGSADYPTQSQMEALKRCPEIKVQGEDDLTLTKNKEGCFVGKDNIGKIETKFKFCRVKGVWYFMDHSENPSNPINQTAPLDKEEKQLPPLVI